MCTDMEQRERSFGVRYHDRRKIKTKGYYLSNCPTGVRGQNFGDERNGTGGGGAEGDLGLGRN